MSFPYGPINEETWFVKWVEHDYSKDYLTFEILTDGTINWKAADSCIKFKTISYSKNNGASWTNITSSREGTSFNVRTGDILLFKGNNVAYAASNAPFDYNSFSQSTASFNLKGNIMSLIYEDNYSNAINLESNYSFINLFSYTKVVSSDKLVLPATTLADSCYEGMFSGCTSLTTAPELPAQTLAKNCYSCMFENCTSLTAAPELPATTLAEGCYYWMFYGCTNLTIAPILPAMLMTQTCYKGIFMGCSSLNFIKMMATDISAIQCLQNWVNRVAASGTFVKNSAATWDVSGVNGVPTGWTIETASE